MDGKMVEPILDGFPGPDLWLLGFYNDFGA